MTSLRARAFLGLLRHAHLFMLKLRRPAFDPSARGLEKLRMRAGNPSPLFGKAPKGIRISPCPIGDRTAEWIRPDDLPDRDTGTAPKVMLYFHGGMYVCGSPRGHRNHVAKFVKGSGCPALVVDYCLAPEFPFPAGLEDALATYSHLLETVPPSKIVFIGDSAGGGLCLAALLAARDQGLPLPAGAVAISPWTDLTLSGGSHITNRHKCLSPIGCAEACSRFYAADTSPEHPLISPLFGDLSGLPPMRLYAGSDEILLDDAVLFYEKAKKSGDDVRLTIGQGLFHCYPVCAPIFPEAVAAMAEICGFIREG